jgi:murein L,D-transpeptidase YafK
MRRIAPLTALLCLSLAGMGTLLPGRALAFDLWFAKPSQESRPTATQRAAYTRPGGSGAATQGGRIVDRIVVKKGERRMYLMRNGQPLRSYKVALGYSPVGHKRRQGDGKTPEGVYFIDRRNPASNYRKALGISYPNTADRLHATRRGDNPGGAIMIHGQPNRKRDPQTGDWTFGCIAVSDMEIDEIYEVVEVGTPIEILP